VYGVSASRSFARDTRGGAVAVWCRGSRTRGSRARGRRPIHVACSNGCRGKTARNVWRAAIPSGRPAARRPGSETRSGVRPAEGDAAPGRCCRGTVAARERRRGLPSVEHRPSARVATGKRRCTVQGCRKTIPNTASPRTRLCPSCAVKRRKASNRAASRRRRAMWGQTSDFSRCRFFVISRL
jgi:hypothetical protein